MGWSFDRVTARRSFGAAQGRTPETRDTGLSSAETVVGSLGRMYRALGVLGGTGGLDRKGDSSFRAAVCCAGIRPRRGKYQGDPGEDTCSEGPNHLCPSDPRVVI